MTSHDPGIGLSQAIQAVREELRAAVVDGEDAELNFPVAAVELEFLVGMTWEAKSGAKARFWVLDWEASGGLQRERTHTVRVTLGPPVDPNGEVIQVQRRLRRRP